MNEKKPDSGKGINPLPFAAMPHAVYADRNLNPGDRDLLAVLLRFAMNKTKCWPSNQRLAKILGVTPRTVQNRRGRLEKAGWIIIEQTPKRRIIHLYWKGEADFVPPAKPASHPPAKPAASEEERNRKQIHTMIENIGKPGEPVVSKNPESPTSNPRRRKVGLTTEELEKIVRQTNDPILAKELAHRKRPRPSPLLPPSSTEEMILRLREDPTFVPKLTELLAQDFDDRKSWMALHKVVERAWRGEIALEDLSDAYRQAMGPKARNRGAVFMTVLKGANRRRHQA